MPRCLGDRGCWPAVVPPGYPVVMGGFPVLSNDPGSDECGAKWGACVLLYEGATPIPVEGRQRAGSIPGCGFGTGMLRPTSAPPIEGRRTTMSYWYPWSIPADTIGLR